MAIRIAHFFETHKLFTNSQYGFRMDLNTTLGILDLVSNILNAFDESTYTRTALCGLSKAFDCILHDLFSTKLKRNNFDNSSLSLIG